MLGTLCKSSSFLHLCSLLRLGDGGRKPSPQTAPHLTQSTRVNNSVPMTEENTHVKNEQDLHAQCPCLSHSLCIEVLHVKDTISLPKIKVYIHTHTHTHTTFRAQGTGSYKLRRISAVMICRNASVMLLNNIGSVRFCNTVYKSMKSFALETQEHCFLYIERGIRSV